MGWLEPEGAEFGGAHARSHVRLIQQPNRDDVGRRPAADAIRRGGQDAVGLDQGVDGVGGRVDDGGSNVPSSAEWSSLSIIALSMSGINSWRYIGQLSSEWVTLT